MLMEKTITCRFPRFLKLTHCPKSKYQIILINTSEPGMRFHQFGEEDKFPRYVLNQLNIFVPVGNDINIVIPVKYALVSVSKPIVYI